ncbi:MAG: hypothetical protein QW726_01410, partial [Fervidicoccaceae archaeon]
QYLVEELLKLKRDKLNELVEWLWEEYGIKTKPNIEAIREAILRNSEITSREIAIEIIRSGGYVNEDMWLSSDSGNLQNNQRA